MRDADTDRGRWAADGFYGFCPRQRRHVRDGAQKGERAAGKETSPANEAQGSSMPAAPACVAQQRLDYGDPTLAMHPHLARCSILAVGERRQVRRPISTRGGGASAVLTQKIDIKKLAPAANQHPSRRPVALISGQPRLPARCPNL